MSCCFAATLKVPKSPHTPTMATFSHQMGHQISHRFQKKFKMMGPCAVCNKPIYFGSGLKCKECKYKCHRECEDKVVPSCGLPPELLEEFKRKWPTEKSVFSSPTSGRSSNAKTLIETITKRKSSHPQASVNHIPVYSVSTRTYITKYCISIDLDRIIHMCVCMRVAALAGTRF